MELAADRNDLGWLERLRAESDLLMEQIDEASHDRRTHSHSERARVAVTKNIKRALDHIAALHPYLAEHLNATVRRGYFCSYTPDPHTPIVWERD